VDENYNSQQPEVVQTGGPNGPTQQSNAIGVTGLVTGILGVIFAVCCYPLGILLGIVAVICGFVAKNKNQKFALAGIILGFVSIGLAIVIIILGIIGASFMENMDWEEIIRQLEEAQ
jgi:Na+/melibiose symporter-like transporter